MNILKEICRKLYCPECDETARLLQIISEISSEKKALSGENKTLINSCNFNDSKSCIDYIVKHNNMYFVVAKNMSFDYMGRIREITYKGYDLHRFTDKYCEPFPFIKIELLAGYNYGKDYLENLFIRDFMASEDRRDSGYGSILLKRAIAYGKRLNIQRVTGFLSFVDIGTETNRTEQQRVNRERLHHFYQKFGFTIDTIIEEDQDGKKNKTEVIELVINNPKSKVN